MYIGVCKFFIWGYNVMKNKSYIFAVLGFLVFMFMLFVAGGIEWGTLSLKTGIICSVASLVLLSICVYNARRK